MAKRRKRSAKRRKRGTHSGSGTFCVTTTKPRKGGKGRGGLSFSTVCYGSQAKAAAALPARAKGSYTAMLHRRGKGR